MNIVNDELIKKWEKLKLKAYMPTKNDVPTIGWGHTQGVKMGDVITKAKAQEFFEQDTAWVMETIDDLVTVPLNQNQYDALASWIFNIGRTNATTSTLIRKLNMRDYEGAAQEFPRWNKQKGKVLGGLVRRRAEEMAYFLSAPESPASATVDQVDPLKNMLKSKELMGGAGIVLTSVAQISGTLEENAQLLAVGAVLVIGSLLIINRLVARRNGDR